MTPPQLLEHWYKTCDWLLDKCDRFPKHTRFTLTGRIGNLALDILELLIEAAYSKEKKKLLTRVNLQLEKLRFLLRISYDRKYLSLQQYEFIQKELVTAGKMCGGWIKSCSE
jgi:hypothetical protein